MEETPVMSGIALVAVAGFCLTLVVAGHGGANAAFVLREGSLEAWGPVIVSFYAGAAVLAGAAFASDRTWHTGAYLCGMSLLAFAWFNLFIASQAATLTASSGVAFLAAVAAGVALVFAADVTSPSRAAGKGFEVVRRGTATGRADLADAPP